MDSKDLFNDDGSPTGLFKAILAGGVTILVTMLKNTLNELQCPIDPDLSIKAGRFTLFFMILVVPIVPTFLFNLSTFKQKSKLNWFIRKMFIFSFTVFLTSFISIIGSTLTNCAAGGFLLCPSDASDLDLALYLSRDALTEIDEYDVDLCLAYNQQTVLPGIRLVQKFQGGTALGGLVVAVLCLILMEEPAQTQVGQSGMGFKKKMDLKEGTPPTKKKEEKENGVSTFLKLAISAIAALGMDLLTSIVGTTPPLDPVFASRVGLTLACLIVFGLPLLAAFSVQLSEYAMAQQRGMYRACVFAGGVVAGAALLLISRGVLEWAVGGYLFCPGSLDSEEDLTPYLFRGLLSGGSSSYDVSECLDLSFEVTSRLEELQVYVFLAAAVSFGAFLLLFAVFNRRRVGTIIQTTA
eukprot:gnl/Dysnectes_brevis/2437_a2900_993.p1 GENE.gnl/Dysnectes_brevis/2437_a2900_993~~gnl/Dysnectes_brevis/2437_a2900_993.p1  ORF type:complete len:409 (+),score=96.86 gnl/Dysnectes_brevis/2437_a2900_993:194-1420(+)